QSTMKFFLVLALIAVVYGQTIQEIEQMIGMEDDADGITDLVKILSKNYPQFIKDDEMSTVAKELQFIANSTDKSGEVLLSIAPLIMGKVMRLAEQTKAPFESLSKETKLYLANLKTDVMIAHTFNDKEVNTVDDLIRTFNSIFDPLYDDFNSQSE
ncbi:hypothetical protein PFISCL1PPCAC_1428, partial [Pristionchus fissidentatus]